MKITYGFLVFLGLSFSAQAVISKCTCPTGPRGPAGIDGVVGPKGTKGIKGVRGDKGAVGAVGPQGATGRNGVPGANGRNLPGPPGQRGYDAPCPPECMPRFRSLFAGRSINSYEPHTIYKVSAEGEMVPIKKLNPTPALRAVTEYLKTKNLSQNDDEAYNNKCSV